MKTTINLSKAVHHLLYDETALDMGRRERPYELGGWSSQEHAVYLYDKYDIWKVDPDGETKPINLTNGYGRAHKTILREVHFD